MKPASLASQLVCVLTVSTLWGALFSAQAAPSALLPRVGADKRAQHPLAADTPVERLVVKFHEGSHVRMRGQALRPLDAERAPAERSLLARHSLTQAHLHADVAAVQILLERTPRISPPGRLFPGEEAVLEARQAQGEARGGRQLADLNLYFQVPLLPGTTLSRGSARAVP
jgi:serine protease